MTPSSNGADRGTRILEGIRRRVGDIAFRTWFEGVVILVRRGRRVVAQAPTGFHANVLADRHHEAIADAAAEELGGPVEVEIAVRPRAPAPGTGVAFPPARAAEPKPPLRSEYTFDRYVAGPANRFALAAAQAVADHPGQQYNPLFIHGAVGLGKTHLLQAIARSCVERGLPNVVAITCSQFTDDFIASIGSGDTEGFRQRYRSAGALLIDDIQFLEEKHHTQEEFFHTFNTLTNLGRQIVLTSDCSPDEIAGLGERLVSRFRRGLVAQLTPPDLETRIAIVVRKGRDLGIEIAPDIAELVAQRVRENVREIEGAVLRLHSLVHLERRSLDLEATRSVLSELFGEANPRIDLLQIQQAIVDEYDIKPADLQSRRRTRSIVVPRQVGMYLARRLTSSSLGEIGLYFGGRDHTTVLHAVQKIAKLRDTDIGFRRRLDSIESALLR